MTGFDEPLVAIEVESCDGCARVFAVNLLTGVWLPDATSELRCPSCVDALRVELMDG